MTSDLNGNLATDGGAVFDKLDDLEEGVAMALALPGVGFLPDDKRVAFNGSVGAFEGSWALAFAGAFKVNETLQFDGGLAVGLNEGNFGGRAGVTLAW